MIQVDHSPYSIKLTFKHIYTFKITSTLKNDNVINTENRQKIQTGPQYSE